MGQGSGNKCSLYNSDISCGNTRSFTSEAGEATTRDIVFTSGPVDLHGTLRTPANANSLTPGVVLVHGSGPQNRDQYIEAQGGFVFQPFKDIAEYLVTEGFTVLTYDKRTCSMEAQGCIPQLGKFDVNTVVVDDFAFDAANAVSYLAGLTSEVNSEDIALIGHSQGSDIVSLVADDDRFSHAHPSISKVVKVMGLGSRIDAVTISQLERLQSPMLDNAKTVVAKLHDGTWSSEDTLLGAYASFWARWNDITDTEFMDSQIRSLAKKQLPLIAFNSVIDFNVPPDTYEHLHASCARVGYPTVTYKDLSHILTPVTGSHADMQTVHPVFQRDLSNYLKTGALPETDDDGQVTAGPPSERGGWLVAALGMIPLLPEWVTGLLG